jgi:hypothetical protein
MSTENELPKIGYLYHFPDLNHPTDRFRLDVNISVEPTHKHFDIIRTKFPVFSQRDGAGEISVHHPWTEVKEYQVCPGLIIMEDRNRKKKEGFTLGGKLTIKVEARQTICKLTSEAPIFGINEASAVEKLLIDDLEVLFAEYQTNFPHSEKFKSHLCKIKPFILYMACLKELVHKVKAVHKKDDLTFDYLIYLHTQWNRLEAIGKIPSEIQRLDELFEV